MFFSMDVLRARKGDCLMLHYGKAGDPHVVMIDGGPSKVYQPHLKPRIDRLRAARGLKEGQPIVVDVVMVSHVDDDHIKGILELTSELRELVAQHGPTFLRAKNLWHNTFDDLLKTTPKVLSAYAGFGIAALGGADELGHSEDLDTVKVLASIPQGRTLRDDAKILKWDLNAGFTDNLILATDEVKKVSMDGGLKFTVIGPMKNELEALQKEHDKYLRGQERRDSEAALAAFVDKSIPNLSSIVLLAEVDGATMLLTGDARGDKILEGLQLARIIESSKSSKLHVNLLKAPHHGSSNNLETVFFERITADHYVFSGDGEYGNPERESLEMLWDARGDDDYTVHLTYPVDELDVERKKEWEKQRAAEKAKGKSPRSAWSAKKHSLTSLFDDNEKFANKLSIVEDGKPHIIDLLDEVKF